MQARVTLATCPRSWLRLAAEVLTLYTEHRVSTRCSDWHWPKWFPVDERALLVREMERWNDPNVTDDYMAESLQMYATRANGPPDFFLAGYFVHLLREAGKE